MTAFERAWALSKFDFHFSPASSSGHHKAKEMGNTRPAQYARNKEYDQKPKMKDIGQQQAVHSRKGSRNWVDLSTAIDKPATPPPTQNDKGTYHRGESTPRLNDDGSYTGVNLSRLDFTDDENWDKDIEQMASIGAHETVHRLQNNDITEWAKNETGYEDKPISLDDWDDFDQPLPQKQERNYKTLRSIGHEFGAYSATPDSSQPSGFMSPKKRKEMMSGSRYKGAEYSMGDKPFSDLREKSEPMTAFDTAWGLLKASFPTELKIDNCHVCEDTAVVAELELPYSGNSISLMCEKCWEDEMDWRLRQQRGEKEPYNPDLAEFGRMFGIPDAGHQPIWPPHMIPIIPWPYDGDINLEGYE